MRLLRPTLAGLLLFAAACGKPADPPPPPPPPPPAEPPAPPPPPAPPAPVVEVDASDRPFEGLFEWGGEGNKFRACDGAPALTMQVGAPGLGELAGAYMRLRVPPYEPVYVQLTGRRVEQGGRAVLAVTSHQTLRVRAPSDCPKLPPNPKRPRDPLRRGLPTDR